MTNYAKVGGILSIISGAFCIFQIAMVLLVIFMFRFMFSDAFFPSEAVPDEEFFPMFTNVMTLFYGVWGLISALTGALAIIGGIFALQRRNWGLSLAGAICGTFNFFPCGIPAIIFVSLARPEFLAAEPAAPLNEGSAPPPV